MSRVVSGVVSSFVAVVVSALGAAPAFAQDPPAPEPAAAPPPVAQQTAVPAGGVFDKPGFDFGLRLGYGLPLGNTAGDNKLSEGVSGVIPVVLEAGYRVNADFTVGALFQYGFGQI